MMSGMKKLLIAVIAGLFLVVIPTASAESFYIQCGGNGAYLLHAYWTGSHWETTGRTQIWGSC